MKTIKKYLILGLFPLSAIFSGCADQLDLKNIESYDPSDVWSSVSTAQVYVNHCYSITLPECWPDDGGWTDEAPRYINKGSVTSDNDTRKCWLYNQVRDVNIGMEEIEKSNLKDKDKSELKGQLKFLRAYLYFRMVKTHGGVPIVDHVLDMNEDLYYSRNSTAECFDFIIKDLDDAIASDLSDRNTGVDYGKIDKSAVKAFKGRVLNFKASPLFNPSNPWDNKYWNEAYEANKKAYNDLQSSGFKLVDNYSDLFADENAQPFECDEYILTHILRYPNSGLGWMAKRSRPLSQSEGDTGANQPVWEFVQLYTMADGKPIGESEKYPYEINTYFKNRDPRFYASIYYNGSIAEFSGIKGRRQYCTDDIGMLGEPKQNDDAVRNDPSEAHYERTGFFPKKYLQEELDLPSISYNDIDYPILRFAEVLLNYAESANETGHVQEAADLIKLLRARAGIEAGSDGNYGLKIDRKSMRTIIQNEFAVEFLHEGHRYDDMRRWRRLSEWDNKSKHVLYAKVKPEFWVDPDTKEALIPGKSANKYELLPEDFTYEVRPYRADNGLTKQSIPESYYFIPIQQRHIDLDPKLEQNTGWDNGIFNPTLE